MHHFLVKDKIKLYLFKSLKKIFNILKKFLIFLKSFKQSF